MSDTPNDESGDSNQGEQPDGSQGGQSAGGRGGQPQGQAGGQPAQGQPQAGAPQGQPQGQRPQGQAPQGQAPQGQAQRAPVNTGPSIGDIFSRKDTLDQIKLGVVMYAIVGFGLGLGLFGIGSAYSSIAGGSFTGQFAQAVAASTLGAPFVLSAVLGFILSEQISDELEDVATNLVLATTGVTALAGTLVVVILDIIMIGIGTGSISFNNLILPMVLAAIGSAIIAAGRIWAEENLLGPSGAPPQQGGQQY